MLQFFEGCIRIKIVLIRITYTDRVSMPREVSEWGASEVQSMKDIQAVVSAAVEGFAPTDPSQ